MFKVLILQASHGLSDEQTEYLIRDRLSFMRFLGLGLADTVPDANTIWTFREALTRAKLRGKSAIEVLFKRFDAALSAAGFLATSGQIIDATIVAAPKQRNTDGEKREIKEGRIPAAEWAKKPAKLRQKDRDARWTVKYQDRAGQSRLQCEADGLAHRSGRTSLSEETVTRGSLAGRYHPVDQQPQIRSRMRRSSRSENALLGGVQSFVPLLTAIVHFDIRNSGLIPACSVTPWFPACETLALRAGNHVVDVDRPGSLEIAPIELLRHAKSQSRLCFDDDRCVLDPMTTPPQGPHRPADIKSARCALRLRTRSALLSRGKKIFACVSEVTLVRRKSPYFVVPGNMLFTCQAFFVTARNERNVMIPVMPPTKPTEPSPGRGLGSRLADLPGVVAGAVKSAPAVLADAARHTFLPWMRTRRHGQRLECVTGSSRSASSQGVVVVSPFYGNEGLVAPFLDHHRRLGISEFVFLDLSLGGGLAARLNGEPGCAVWRKHIEPKHGEAIHLLNYLRARYATGRWCLSLEPSEIFVFHRSESRKIHDLIEFLETEGRAHIYATIVEMYGDRPAGELDFEPGTRPLDALPFFDPTGYTTASGCAPFDNVVLQGGVQRRAVFAGSPQHSPVLNRVPLVKWHRFHAYLAGTRLLTPYRLNAPHYWYHTSPTACLLRFALLDGDAALATAAKAEAGGLVSALPYAHSYSGIASLRHAQLKRDFSVRFNSSADLIECGLLNAGQWF